MQDQSGRAKPMPRVEEQFCDGWQHDLKPLEPLDVRKVRSFSDMLSQMARTSFGARNLGEAADVLYEMVTDPKCFVVGTFSGAMTIAKMGLVLTDMIDQGMLNAIVCTGAILCHGMVEQSGKTHFRYDPSWDDEKLYGAGYSRVYDTLELERNLDVAERVIHAVSDELSREPAVGSFEFNRRLGEYLRRNFDGRGILQSAYEKNVPVYVPAFSDNELGIDVFVYNVLAERRERPPLRFDALRDTNDYIERVCLAERVGIFTVGGGAPRNWAQEAGPIAELLHFRTKGERGGLVRFRYAVRICPEPAHWGGLSGCTYSENVSWGKLVPPSEGGRFAEVLCDATIAWPILIRGVLERLGRV